MSCMSCCTWGIGREEMIDELNERRERERRE